MFRTQQSGADVNVTLFRDDGRPGRMTRAKLQRSSSLICHIEIPFLSPAAAASAYGKTIDLTINGTERVTGVVTGINGLLVTVRVRRCPAGV